jgi:hypothetical protein
VEGDQQEREARLEVEGSWHSRALDALTRAVRFQLT